MKAEFGEIFFVSRKLIRTLKCDKLERQGKLKYFFQHSHYASLKVPAQFDFSLDFFLISLEVISTFFRMKFFCYKKQEE
jgi:hypothetical protein